MSTKHRPLTEFELEIMQAVWERDTATVRQVADALRENREIAYTTVMTMMNILVEKGHLEREKEGRAFRYRPTRAKTQVISQMVEEFLGRVFGGSARPLVLNLVRDRHLSESDLEDIKTMIREAEKGVKP